MFLLRSQSEHVQDWTVCTSPPKFSHLSSSRPGWQLHLSHSGHCTCTYYLMFLSPQVQSTRKCLLYSESDYFSSCLHLPSLDPLSAYLLSVNYYQCLLGFCSESSSSSALVLPQHNSLKGFIVLFLHNTITQTKTKLFWSSVNSAIFSLPHLSYSLKSLWCLFKIVTV